MESRSLSCRGPRPLRRLSHAKKRAWRRRSRPRAARLCAAGMVRAQHHNDSERGLGGWGVADIAAYLKNGHNPTTASTGIMAEEITLSSSHLTDADLTAIATYLKDLPGQTAAPPAPVSASDPKMVAGEAIYADACSACHGLDGKGVPYLFPSLAGSPNVRSTDPASLIHVLIEGARSVATAGEPTGPGMPSFAWKLSDDQAAAVLSYIRNSWGASAPAVDAPQVAQGRARASTASGR